MSVYIYALIDPRTDEIRYVGKSVTPQKRLAQHTSRAKRGVEGRNPYKNNWINQLIREDVKPRLRIIEKVSDDSWEDREIYWIFWFREVMGFRLVNLEKGGNGANRLAEETKEKISESLKEYYADNPGSFTGRKHSKEARRKIAEKAKERLQDPTKNPRYGVAFSHTEESKQKIKQTHLKKKINRGSSNAQAILTEKDVREIKQKYEPYKYTQSMLGEEYGVSQTTIWEIIKGRKWKHVN